jgi:tetratricopeptide (TPR) repeat protein
VRYKELSNAQEMQKAGPRATLWSWRSVVVVAVALAALLLIERWQSSPIQREQPDQQPLALAGVARTYSEAMAQTDLAIANAEAQVAAANDQWLLHENVARNYVERARLSGNYDDYAAADAALKRAFAVAAPGTGPHLVRAQFDFRMHRLAEAERQLALIEGYAIPSPPDERAEILAMRGDIAFYRGNLKAALQLYKEADRLSPGTATFRRAIYAMKTGDFERAESTFDQTEREARLLAPQLHAFIELQRGLLDLERGNWPSAENWFRKADRTFPGYWLTQAHLVQMWALRGKVEQAEQGYRKMIEHSEQPEVMDALAALYRSQGDAVASREWAERSGAIWAKRLQQFPQAAYGHALEHELVLGNPATALALARQNMAARPYGDSATLLGWALLANNRPAEARDVLERLGGTAWRSAQQYAALSQAHAMLGDSDRSRAARDAALGINPRAFDPSAPLIWFGHH